MLHDHHEELGLHCALMYLVHYHMRPGKVLSTGNSYDFLNKHPVCHESDFGAFTVSFVPSDVVPNFVS